jgi:predicted CxxxxCH...CXXCH cytochrome family protein
VGAFAYDPVANTCSNVSCHGGQTTPSWASGSINVNTDCTRCHALGTAQFNSFNSGRFTDPNLGVINLHDFHINSVGVICIDCHNTTNLAFNHFTHLETQIMEGPASATIGGGTGIVTYVPGNVPGSGSCTPIQNNPNFFCHFNTILGNTRAW